MVGVKANVWLQGKEGPEGQCIPLELELDDL